MKQFDARMRDGTITAIKYHPLVYTRGSEIYSLALHKVGRNWQISDPASGGKILTVTALYKGCPVASGSLTIPQARACALADLDMLVDRIGLDRFATTLRGAPCLI